MNKENNPLKTDRKVILSTLWIFVMFNYLYCDLMGLMDPALLSQFIEGNIDGIAINEKFLLGAALLMEIPIAMVLLSRVLPYKANRWTNITAAAIKSLVMIATMFMGSGPTLYYLFFGMIEIACTLFIIWYAWQWENPEWETGSI